MRSVLYSVIGAAWLKNITFYWVGSITPGYSFRRMAVAAPARRFTGPIPARGSLLTGGQMEPL
jgi:hypothetical protein